MYLRSLELQGFKSFPDKTILNFNKGITAVVGPNGSGKSNIGDAMRWVMGEQSSKALRGEKMSGVIFHGTQSRPKSPFAQVTITIDNEDHALDLESDLVSVSRKLYQNGNSDYMINGKVVMLKDVYELFLDTGLGKDGYSIIGQGRIADIVNGKSNERREIFEEAAGISKFRYKKEKAEKKLVAAEDNISRLNDILSELEGRIGPLKNQCEKAKKFRVLDDEKKQLEVSVWTYKLDGYMSKLNEYGENLKVLKEQYNTISDELEDDENKINEYFQKSAEKAGEVDKLKGQIHEIELENSKASSDIAVFENDISHLEDNILQTKDQIEQLRSSKYYLEAELEKRRNDLKALSEKQQKDNDNIANKEKEFNTLLSETEESNKNLAEVNNAINAVYLKRSELNFKLESSKNSLSDTEEQLEKIQSEKNELEKNSDFTESELRKLRKQKNDADEKSEETNNRLNGMIKLTESKRAKLKSVTDNFSKTDIQLRETTNKLQLLNDLESSMEGFAYSVKNVMKAAKQGRLTGVCGSVAQVITVKAEYSAAIETALGGALQNIIVENEETAKRGIKLLKEQKAGRATFLPVTSVRGNRLENSQLEKENGFVAMGCDLVECDAKYRGIVNSLLGRICVAEDIDIATVIAKKYGFKFRIVTLDGQVINAGGSFTGGSLAKSAGILTRKNEIDKLSNSKIKLEEEHKELSEQRQKLIVETEKFEADIEGLKESLNYAKSECLKLEMEIKRVSDFSMQYEEKLEKTEAESNDLKKKITQYNDDIENAVKELERVEKLIEENEAELSDSRSRQDELRQRREKISDELSELRVIAAETVKDTQSCRASIAQLTDSLENGDTDNGKLEEKIVTLENEIAVKKKSICDIRDRLSGTDSRVDDIKKDIEKAQNEHLEFDRSANILRNRTKSKSNEKETLSEQITRSEERMKNISADFDKLVGQLWDEYELTRSEAAEVAEELDDIGDANKKLAELKNKIKALGNVNLGAIEEYAEVNERYEFMNGQLDDVKTSKRELEELIDELTENMKSMFVQSFDNINSNFKKIFAELFGGGKGELILTDPENVLECGIEINVQPPGKVITNLMSLSGGEQALVAIAIYFAILKISPSPFCLLDEIEAALDDVNVSRYAQYLHHLTDKTQFITITHRRGTMEEADVLYGVTMQEKGISKLLKMSAEETRQMKFEE